MKHLKLHKLFYFYFLITIAHGSFKGIQQNVIFAIAVNPNKLENNKKLQSDLVTYVAANMAVNATELASCMVNENNIHDWMCG